MTQLVSDAFTYSNGALDTVSGGVWAIQTTAGGGLAVISNEVRESSASSLGRFTTTAPPSSDYYSEVKLTTVLANVSDEGVGPAVRVVSSGTDQGTGYFAQCNSVETKLYQVVTGAFLQVGSNGVACALGDVVRIEVSGTGATVSLVVKRNGTAIITAGDASAGRITATNSYGIWCSHGGGQGQLDNFAGGDFAVADVKLINQRFDKTFRPRPFAPGNAR